MNLRYCFLIIVILFVFWIGFTLIRDGSFNRSLVRTPGYRPSESGKIDQVLYDMINGHSYDSSQVELTRQYLDGRYDCADFKIPSILRILYDHEDGLEPDDYDKLKDALINFKYWMTDPGDDGMCYWSENHQILFASAEYLAGSLFPDEIFTNTGLTGGDLARRGEERVRIWLKQRWDYGFTEWYSNTYYKEDLGPLGVLIDFAPHGDIRLKASIITDLLMYDMASQSFRGTFVSTMGRGYEEKKMGGQKVSVSQGMEHFFGFPVGKGELGDGGMGLNLIYSKNYRLPEVLGEIARDDGSAAIKASLGLDLEELKEKGLIGPEDSQIMMQWAMESFTNPQTISNTMDYVKDKKLLTNTFLYDLKILNYAPLRRLGLLPLISRLANPQTNGIVIERANTYTWRTPFYSLYTAQKYHPGEYGDQHHISGITLADDLSLFHNHPAAEAGEGGVNGNSPDYWVGYGVLPHAVQHENVSLALYELPRNQLPYTHAYFPSRYFDESSVEGGIAFGRRGDAYAAFITPGPLTYRYHEEEHPIGGGEYDLVLEGRDVYWITLASFRESEGSYEAFKNRVTGQARDISYSRGILTFADGDHRFVLNYQGDFLVDGEKITTDYPRYDSPYIIAEREPKELLFQWKGKELYLNFDRGIREEKGKP